jgi:hypothetical protein
MIITMHHQQLNAGLARFTEVRQCPDILVLRGMRPPLVL